VQFHGSRAVDASLLLLPLTGFLPPDDPRIIGTVAAIERDTKLRRQVGNFPQAFSHLALVELFLALNKDAPSMRS
jgi:GH15 family glucan-1,4-alpha-glucosidase